MMYDAEDFRNALLAIAQNGFSDMVDEINAEKGDTLLEDIPAAQWFTSVHAQVMSHKNFVHYFVSNIETESVGDQYIQTVTVAFLVTSSRDHRFDADAKSLRYSELLARIFAGEHRALKRVSDLELKMFAPVDVVTAEDGQDYVLAGVEITGSIVKGCTSGAQQHVFFLRR